MSDTFVGYAVVDFETTGSLPENHDRLLEVSVVHLSPNGEVTGQWETIIRPERDGQDRELLEREKARSTAMAESFPPSFQEISGALARMLSQRVFVSHNASHGLRFLRAEYLRIGLEIPIQEQANALCTMELTEPRLLLRKSLKESCAAYDIELGNDPTTADKARATAHLLKKIIQEVPKHPMWHQYLDRASYHHWPRMFSRESAWVPRSALSE
ncbi:MAG: 3'-5' exonuclease [Microbacteriaceae bacterium]